LESGRSVKRPTVAGSCPDHLLGGYSVVSLAPGTLKAASDWLKPFNARLPTSSGAVAASTAATTIVGLQALSILM
jgi:hypothetical protein